MQNYSVTTTLVPSAISFATCLWLVIRTSKLPHPIRSGSILFVGSLISFASSSMYLDNAIMGWSFRDIESAFAALLGAVVFSTSTYLSRVAIRSKTAVATSFVIFAIAAFAALVIFQHSLKSSLLPYIIFLCSACFQSIVLGAIAIVAAPGTKAIESHRVTAAKGTATELKNTRV